MFSSRTSAKAAVAAMMRDAHHHVSPNAGWPESALAGALGIRLGGPRSYDGRHVDLATMGDGTSELDRDDIRAGPQPLFGRALSLLTVLSVLAALWLSLSVIGRPAAMNTTSSAHGGDRLIGAPGFVAKAARQRIVGHDAETHFVGHDDNMSLAPGKAAQRTVRLRQRHPCRDT